MDAAQTQSERLQTPHVGARTRWVSEERLRFMAQTGVEEVFLEIVSPGYEADVYPDDVPADSAECLEVATDNIPSVERLESLRSRVEAAGLTLGGIHTLQYGLYDDLMFGNDGRDRQLEAIQTLIERLGEAGCDTLGYQWNPRGVVPMRTEREAEIRGGATATQWDESELGEIEEPAGDLERTYTAEECWENFEYFLDGVIPVAESAGVQMALHPTDPPGYEEIGGIPRLFSSVEAFDRALEHHPSESNGLKLCLGCFSEIGEDIPALIRHFGESIVFVHFRDVVGTVPRFTETFLDEGNFDPFEATAALHDVGFDGALLLDHVPNVDGDTAWGHRSRAYGNGYLRCLIDGLGRE
jgi:mannonate dehydratase